MISKNPRRKIGGRLDVTFPGEVFQVVKTQTTYLTPLPIKVHELLVLNSIGFITTHTNSRIKRIINAALSILSNA